MSEALRKNRLPVLAILTAVVLGIAGYMAFFYAPMDADQELSQRIFYFHVPIALTAYAGFGWGAWKALRYLWKGDEKADLESYVGIHQGIIFGSLTLLTGSLWARISWGHWWNWSDTQLTLFLVLFLFYCAYFMLRFSVDDGASRANISAVYALFGVVLVPVSFLAIRLAKPIIHPEVFKSSGPAMAGSQFATFCVAWLGMTLLFATLYQLELSGKRLDQRLRETPGDPDVTAQEKYTAAAYLVVLVGLIAYVGIIAAKLGRLEREVGDLVELAAKKLGVSPDELESSDG